MDEQSAPEFWFEPSAFGRHDLIRISDVHQLLEGRREHRKCDGAFPAVDALHQLARTADAADEVDALAGARIVDAEQRCEQARLKAGPEGCAVSICWIKAG